ncbi:MAG: glucose 1-dehydrogenase [Desulfobacterales bacterium]
MILSQFSLKDRIAIVTGAGRGIGKGIALGFAEAGAHVAVCSRTLEQVEATAYEIRKMGRKSIAMQVDVRDSSQVQQMVDQTVKEFSRIDILVNNAGGGFHAPLLDLSERAWDALIRENARPIFLFSKAVAAKMVDQKSGNIINISSIAGLGSGGGAYGAAKAAVNNLTVSMALEWAPHNVRVNCIAPGTIETQAFRDTNENLDELRSQIPLARFGKPEDVALAAIYLASEAGRYVTGEILVVDGGLRI